MKWIENWFSNFVPFDVPMEHHGITYTTPEHFFQAMKVTDPNRRQYIAEQQYPGQAKIAGRIAQGIRDDWDNVKESYMLYALRYKYQKGTTHYDQLMSTGDWDIVEWNNWHDNYWGNCICSRCKNKEGKNRLGVLLMQIRKEGVRINEYKI